MALDSPAPPASSEPRSGPSARAVYGGEGARGGVSDAEAIAVVLGGDAEAYVILVRRYRDTYARIASCLLAGATAVDDAQQAALVRAFNSLDRCPPDAFGAWLYALVLQECETIDRRAAHSRRGLVDDASDAERMRDALAALPFPEREAFVLHLVEELTYDEMIRLTGRDGAMLRARVEAACGILRARFGGGAQHVAGRITAGAHEDATIAGIVAAPLRGSVRAGDDLEERVMSAVRIEARARTRLREGRTPSGAFDAQSDAAPPRRTMPITPLGLTALVAVVGLVGAGLGIALGRSSPRPLAAVAPLDSPLRSAPVLDTQRVVRFTFVDSAARTVSLVGDFNAWAVHATPMARDSESGMWSVALPLSAGRHEYAFVVDGTRWALDPAVRRTAGDSSRETSELDVRP